MPIAWAETVHLSESFPQCDRFELLPSVGSGDYRLSVDTGDLEGDGDAHLTALRDAGAHFVTSFQRVREVAQWLAGFDGKSDNKGPFKAINRQG